MDDITVEETTRFSLEPAAVPTVPSSPQQVEITYLPLEADFVFSDDPSNKRTLDLNVPLPAADIPHHPSTNQTTNFDGVAVTVSNCEQNQTVNQNSDPTEVSPPKQKPIRRLSKRGNGPHKCGYCQKGFKKRFWLEEHIKTHTEEMPYNCFQCETSFKTRIELKNHRNSHDGAPFLCGECGKTFDSRSRLASHLISHSKERPFSCDLCNMTFKREILLNKHKAFVHDMKTIAKPRECMVCGVKMESLSRLKRHLLSHSKERPFACEKCKKTFKYIEDLKAHEKKEHSRSPEYSISKAKFCCEICDKKCPSKSQLDRHLYSHSNERKFVCDQCDRRCKFPDELIRHKKTFHPAGVPPEMTPKLPKPYRDRKSLNNPSTSKSDNKETKRELSCKECKKGFADYRSMTVHKNRVHGFQPHICLTCGRSFSKETSLNKHNCKPTRRTKLAKNIVTVPVETSTKSSADCEQRSIVAII